MLTIAEELLLLALHDRKGSVTMRASSSLKFGLAGAFISELALNERVAAEGKKLTVINPAPVDDPLLNDVFQEIKNSKKDRKIRVWVEKFGNRMRKRQKTMSSRLVEKGILEESHHSFLGIFTWIAYPASDNTKEEDIRMRVTEALEETDLPDERTLILLSLINACDLVKEVFPKKEARAKKKQIKAWTKRNPYGKAVNEAVDATNAAVYAAAGAAAISSGGSS